MLLWVLMKQNEFSIYQLTTSAEPGDVMISCEIAHFS